METADVALFLHILVLLAAIGLAATLHTAEWRARGATTVGELRLFTRVYAWGKLFPFLILLLLGTGAWLLHLHKDEEHWTVSTPWVWTAIVALVILAVSGGAILDRHAGHLRTALDAASDGPIPAEIAAQASAPVSWAVSHMNTALAVAVVFNMTTKPDTDLQAILVLVTGIVLGSAVGLLGARRKG